MLYDRDHYKLALGQLAVARNLIDRVASGLSGQPVQCLRLRMHIQATQPRRSLPIQPGLPQA